MSHISAFGHFLPENSKGRFVAPRVHFSFSATFNLPLQANGSSCREFYGRAGSSEIGKPWAPDFRWNRPNMFCYFRSESANFGLETQNVAVSVSLMSDRQPDESTQPPPPQQAQAQRQSPAEDCR
jgi:hypothetical protein